MQAWGFQEPIVTVLEFHTITHNEAEHIFHLGLSGMYLVELSLEQDVGIEVGTERALEKRMLAGICWESVIVPYPTALLLIKTPMLNTYTAVDSGGR